MRPLLSWNSPRRRKTGSNGELLLLKRLAAEENKDTDGFPRRRRRSSGQPRLRSSRCRLRSLSRKSVWGGPRTGRTTGWLAAGRPERSKTGHLLKQRDHPVETGAQGGAEALRWWRRWPLSLLFQQEDKRSPKLFITGSILRSCKPALESRGGTEVWRWSEAAPCRSGTLPGLSPHAKRRSSQAECEWRNINAAAAAAELSAGTMWKMNK